MATSLALGPASVGIYTALNVSALTSLVSTRIYDDVPRAPTYPFVWYEVEETQDVRGFGTGGLPEIDLRVHVFSTYQGMSEAQAIGKAAIGLLKDQAISISGYAQAGKVFYDRTLVFDGVEIEGVKVRELVAMFRIYAEEA